MRNVVAVVIGTFILLGCLNAFSYPGEVVHSIPSPSSPFGLTWDGTYLWCGTYGGDIYQIDPGDGTILDFFESPGNMCSGLGWQPSDPPYLLSSCRDSNRVYWVDPVSGAPVDSFDAQENWPGGLAWADSILWHSNYYSPPMIYALDPATGDPFFSYTAPYERPMGLAWDGRFLWNSDWKGGMIYRLEPVSGVVQDSFAAPSSSPHDCTWDGRYLWVVIGGGANKIYQIKGYTEATVWLDPDDIEVPQGGTLGLTITLESHTDTTQYVQVWTEVTLPNGKPYPGNPVLGPQDVPLGAWKVKSKYLTQKVPHGAPLGTYVYTALVGTYPDEVIHEDSFEVTVVPALAGR
jgi:hypothetical protein